MTRLTHTGHFRSEVFFQGKYYDVEWQQYWSDSDGYDIVIKKCADPRTRLPALSSVIADIEEFKKTLAIRGEQIRNANFQH